MYNKTGFVNYILSWYSLLQGAKYTMKLFRYDKFYQVLNVSNKPFIVMCVAPLD